VARWLTRYEGWMTQQLQRGGIASVTPHYPPHRQLRHLPGAQRESNRLARLFAARLVAATSADVLTLLKEPDDTPMAVLHFAGHGSFDEAMPLFSTIALEDRDLRAAELRSAEVKLGERSRSLVVFNACNTGASGAGGGTVGGWAEVFLHRRFGGFIAPLWGIDDGWAKSLTPELLTLVLEEGERVGRALQRLRGQYGRDSLTYLSYVYYGDVMARFV
jgi:CHAT domain-containing protein